MQPFPHVHDPIGAVIAAAMSAAIGLIVWRLWPEQKRVPGWLILIAIIALTVSMNLLVSHLRHSPLRALPKMESHAD